MNLSSYDIIPPTIDKKKTWLDTKFKQLLSREIKYRPYVLLCNKYVPECNTYDYFIILLDDPPLNKRASHVSIDNYGRLKINLKSIWDNSPLKYINKNQNVSISLREHADDGDIYYLDI